MVLKKENQKFIYITVGVVFGTIAIIYVASRFTKKEEKLDERNKEKLLQLRKSIRTKLNRVIKNLRKKGIEVRIMSALRNCKEQDALYAKGRTKPGPKVTNAKCGESDHNVGAAADIVPLINGQPTWKAPKETWNQIGLEAEAQGLKWGGRWKFKDLPHVYDREGKTRAQLFKELNIKQVA